MKKIICSIVIGLIVFTVTSQNITISKDNLGKVMCKKWHVNSVTLGGLKIGKISDAANFDLLLEENGAYNLVKVTGEKSQGNWVFNADKKYVLLFEGDKIYARIKTVDSAKMIINLEDENNTALSNLDIYLKPF